MAVPIWITPAGSLGVIPDQEFYQLALDIYQSTPPRSFAGTLSVSRESKVVTGVGTSFLADLRLNDILVTPSGAKIGAVKSIVSNTSLLLYMDSSFSYSNIPVAATDPIFYSVVSGKLPTGLHLDQFGNVLGVPINGELEGVPAAIQQVTTSTFTIRATNVEGKISDRTFSITVAGVNPPIITPKNTSLGTYFDGDLLTYQLNVVEPIPGASLTWSLTEGALPPGVSLTSTGMLQGFIEPVDVAEGSTQGYDATPFDKFTFDFFGVNISKNYQFKVSVTDGYTSDTSEFTVFVYSKRTMTADNDILTADNESVVDASIDSKHTPILRNLDTIIEPIRQGGYYAYKFDGYDFDGDLITYSNVGELPPGLTINSTTGWMCGVVPVGPLGSVDYTFTVRVAKEAPEQDYYTEREFTTSVLGLVNNEVIWDTPGNLGIIDNGSISTISIVAHTSSGRSLQYRILYEDPTDETFIGSRLPQGLILLPDGILSGRVSFETFTLDHGACTFDGGATSFDTEYKFTVQAYDSDNYVSGTKQFTIKIRGANLVPYENLYIKALPPREKRDIYSQIINNSDIFPVTDIYRFSDPWFGKNTQITSLFQTGLNPSFVEEYVTAMTLNHYWKNITFGEVKTARALDENFNVKYEVVYAELVDNSVSETGGSPSANIAIRPNSVGITNAYPNSFANMANEVIYGSSNITPSIPGIGYANKSILPEWMTSRQADGRVLGFTRALVLCYTKPSKSAAIAYRVNQRINDLRLVNFTIDRYEWDSMLSANFNKTTETFDTAPETTFDRRMYVGCNGTISTVSGSSVVSGVNTVFQDQLFASNTSVAGDLLIAELPVAGNISCNSSSRTVTGIGTTFTTDLAVGEYIIIDNSYVTNGNVVHAYNRLGQIVSINSNISLTLDANAAVTATSKEFKHTVELGRVDAITSNTQLALENTVGSTLSNVSYGMITSVPTTFDYNQTRFFSNRIEYTNQELYGQQYLKFPNVTITTRSLSS